MRWLLLAAAAASITVGAARATARPSNPAFLGVGLDDLGVTPRCKIVSITPNSPAQVAGLRHGDIFVSIDNTAITDCNSLLARILHQTSGDQITITVQRDSTQSVVKATLLTREEVLRRRGVVGQPVIATALTGVDRQAIDLSDARRGTSIVGWFTASCNGCEAVFSKVARWSAKHATKASPIRVLGAVGGDLFRFGTVIGPETFETLALHQRGFDVPLLLADPEIHESMTLGDHERIYFMVIDHRGIVQHVAPVVPSADDAAAMLDELFATAEQCSHKLK